MNCRSILSRYTFYSRTCALSNRSSVTVEREREPKGERKKERKLRKRENWKWGSKILSECTNSRTQAILCDCFHTRRFCIKFFQSSSTVTCFLNLDTCFSLFKDDTLAFGSIDRDYVDQLEERIEKHLRECLMKWRSKQRTFFNRSAIQKIRKILPRYLFHPIPNLSPN